MDTGQLLGQIRRKFVGREWYQQRFDGSPLFMVIVSRELGVPCIIGTKLATKIFSDGDIVEVNANHNWVRKVIL